MRRVQFSLQGVLLSMTGLAVFLGLGRSLLGEEGFVGLLVFAAGVGCLVAFTLAVNFVLVLVYLGVGVLWLRLISALYNLIQGMGPTSLEPDSRELAAISIASGLALLAIAVLVALVLPSLLDLH